MNTRVNVPNLNQWADPRYYNLAVPGYPDALGSYHTGSTGNIKYYTAEEWAALQESKPNPIGDVTAEEIDYVSRWFRTHYEPVPITINWKDYFIQDISADDDRVVSKPNKDDTKTWSCDKGAIITGAPIYDVPDDYKYEYSQTPLDVDYMQKEKGWKYTNQDRSIDYGMEKMLIAIDPDNRKWDPDKTFADGDNYWKGWEHILNFNSGAQTNNYGDYSDNPNDFTLDKLTDRTMQYYTGSGTADFSYHCTDANKRFHKYTLQHLVFDIPQTAAECEIHKRKCTNHHYDGYYLGFDYEVYLEGSGDLTKKPETTSVKPRRKDGAVDDGDQESKYSYSQNHKICYKPRDGFYSNWIVKISEGFDTEGNKPSEYPKNVILEQGLLVCEDLGKTDYDFNDIVLKLQHLQTKETRQSKAIDRFRITAMAAGGALPSNIYFVGGDGKGDIAVTPDGKEVSDNKDGNEIHYLLNGAPPTIINAAPEFVKEGESWTRNISDLGYSGIENFASYVFDYGLIKIKVDDDRVIQSIKSGYKDTPGDTFHGTPNESQSGDAPQMMFLPVNFLWPQEEVFIGDAYSGFGAWVQDAAQTEWYTTYIKDRITLRSVATAAAKPNLVLETRFHYPDDSGNMNGDPTEPSSETVFAITVPAKSKFRVYLNNIDESDNNSNKVDRFGYFYENLDDENNSKSIISGPQGDPGSSDYGVQYEITTHYAGRSVLTLTIDGYSYITVVVTVVGDEQPEGGDQPGGGDVNYEALYGTPYTKGFTAPSDKTNQFPTDGTKLAIDDLPSGNITITFVVEARYGSGSISGYKWVTDEKGDYSNWDGTTIVQQPQQDINEKYTIIQWTGNASELSQYSFLNCVNHSQSPDGGVYIKVNSSSAKHRSIRRK